MWSIVGVDNADFCRMFRDGLFANGAMAAENAVLWARKEGHRITEIDMITGEIRDPRSGRVVDASSEVIAGIEYRSRRPVRSTTSK
jgi:hypothetical protein